MCERPGWTPSARLDELAGTLGRLKRERPTADGISAILRAALGRVKGSVSKGSVSKLCLDWELDAVVRFSRSSVAVARSFERLGLDARCY
jgi:hypothetical protein